MMMDQDTRPVRRRHLGVAIGKSSRRLVALAMVGACVCLAAQEDAPAPVPVPKDETEIEADRVDADFKTGLATFTGSVRVVDSRMALAADKMLVEFTKENKLKKIAATGNVVIAQPETKRQAMAGRAEYDVVTGKITLTDKPILRDGANEMVGAETIVYFRDSEKVTTEGSGRVFFRLVVPENRTDNMNIFRKDRADEQE